MGTTELGQRGVLIGACLHHHSSRPGRGRTGHPGHRRLPGGVDADEQHHVTLGHGDVVTGTGDQHAAHRHVHPERRGEQLEHHGRQPREQHAEREHTLGDVRRTHDGTVARPDRTRIGVRPRPARVR
ncbi:unannotated protein [freshwater metagenome]|uniref:Unannotated protein n=1 Tax=freshwater metagenome TaxID=449393 RepID=A0A6J6D0Z8_9ZZZZ